MTTLKKGQFLLCKTHYWNSERTGRKGEGPDYNQVVVVVNTKPGYVALKGFELNKDGGCNWYHQSDFKAAHVIEKRGFVQQFIESLTQALIDIVSPERPAITNLRTLNTQTNNKHYPEGRKL